MAQAATSMATEYGKGVSVTVTETEFIIRVKRDANHGVSASGKSVIVATTAGNVSLPGGVKLGLNAYKPV
jgi:hypothetical protein